MTIDPHVLEQMVHVELTAQLAARRILANRDPEMGDWRQAGYTSATEAARALVGAGPEDDVTARTVALVAAALAGDPEMGVS